MKAQIKNFNRFFAKTCLILAVLLIASFVFHALEFEHHHHEIFMGSSVHAISHATEKKKFVAVVIGLLFLVSTVLRAVIGRVWNFEIQSFTVPAFFVFKTADPILMGLSRGRLQAVLYE